MTTVVLIDDQAMIRAGIRGVLESASITVLGEAHDGGIAMGLVREVRPDVVLMDLRMPGVNGIEATKRIRADNQLRSVRVLVLTTFDGDADVLEALRAGADGFISKSAEPEELIEAVIRTAAGESSLSARASKAVTAHLASETKVPDPEPRLVALVQTLTPRERDIVIAAASGADNAQIAAAQFISPFTVKTHLNRAMAKLDARDRGQLVAFAYRSGLVPSRPVAENGTL
jgi:DNA-binding NarL/FixJ family response regulator